MVPLPVPGRISGSAPCSAARAGVQGYGRDARYTAASHLPPFVLRCDRVGEVVSRARIEGPSHAATCPSIRALDTPRRGATRSHLRTNGEGKVGTRWRAQSATGPPSMRHHQPIAAFALVDRRDQIPSMRIGISGWPGGLRSGFLILPGTGRGTAGLLPAGGGGGLPQAERVWRAPLHHSLNAHGPPPRAGEDWWF